MAKRISKRRRLLLKTMIPGVVLVLLGVAGTLYWMNREEKDYTPGDVIEGITSDLLRETPEGFQPVVFQDVTEAAGIDFVHFCGQRSSQLPEDMGSGLAWGDYDGDGDPDLYVVNEAGPLTGRETWSESPALSRLYRNESNGRFVDVTDQAGVGIRDLGMAAAFADVDGDRDLDLLVTSYGALHLFRNLGDGGDGRFEDGTAEAGLDREGYWSGPAFGDYDLDGDIDLYVCGYVEYRFDPEARGKDSSQYTSVIPASLNPSAYPPHPNVLFENDGEGRFTDVTARAGVENREGRSLGAVWCDFDEDGRPDLYVANDISDNVLFRNRGGGRFEESGLEAWVADYRGAMGMAVADWDSDRDLDLFVTHWIAQENALYVNQLSEQRELGTRTSESFVQFQDDADQMGVGQIALDFVGWGTFFFDFDHDARPDLFVANGSTFQQSADERLLVPMRSQLFWNHGPDRGFFEVGAFCGAYFEQEWVARGAACADYDGDGDLDLAVLNSGRRLVLLRNELDNGHHWLKVRLNGRGKNTSALGAKVTLVSGDSVQAYVVGANPSYLSQSDLTLHFGLGESARAGRLEIRWPTGREQVLTDLEGDRLLVVEEEP